MIINALRAEARNAPVSGIEAVVNYGRDRPGLIGLWNGEGDAATPDFIRKAAIQGLDRGETFYTWQGGLPELRDALARYHQRHFGRAFSPDEFVVTIGGMQAITLALQATAGAGDELVYLTPGWPNINMAAAIAGVKPVAVPLRDGANGWTCDVERIAAALSPRSKAIFINSPSNPTGWVADRWTLQAILDLARKHGLWIIADEIYSLFEYDTGRAPSFFDVVDPEDRVIFVNSFSKNWAMTGWRVGWLTAHPSLSRTFENLIQYSSSGVAQFLQRGAVAALDDGDSFVASQVVAARKARDMVCDILGKSGRARFSIPQGAFYLFFTVEGVRDSRAAAFDIVDHANIGLAPGSAFGAEGEAYLRLCFLREVGQLEEAAHRLALWINSHKSGIAAA